MAVYAVGDVQGCFDPLQRLLAKLHFNRQQDQLWLVGDLVNRGPASLAVLRFVRDLGKQAITVLGNHDLSLLAVAAGYVKLRRKDTISDILNAPDSHELLDWLRYRPILHHDPVLGFTMAHAGLAPQWDLAKAQACAAELENTLRGPSADAFLAQMFGAEPHCWHDELSGYERLRCITNYFTRMRFCYADGGLDFSSKGPPGSQPADSVPWFELSTRKHADLNIIFGHWAALGYYRAKGLYALDSGCVWGQRLTALRLDDPSYPVVSVACHK